VVNPISDVRLPNPLHEFHLPNSTQLQGAQTLTPEDTWGRGTSQIISYTGASYVSVQKEIINEMENHGILVQLKICQLNNHTEVIYLI